MRRQAVILGFAAALLLVSAWLFAEERGVAAAAAGLCFGWLARHLAASGNPAVEARPAPVRVDDAAARLQVLEAKTSSLRHDLRGILSPALLTAERLLNNDDPVVRRAGDIMVKTVERASARLAETRASRPDGLP